MRRKYKVCLATFIIAVLTATLLFVLLALDTLDPEFYGLAYNQIIADYTNTNVYESGFYYVGISAYFIKIYRIPKLIKLHKMKTFTSDLNPIEISVTTVYTLNLPKPISDTVDSINQTQNFQFLSRFYKDFGQDPNSILQPLFKNQIIQTVSAYKSSYFQQQSVSAALQLQIQARIQNLVSKWTTMSIEVLIQSIVAQGITRNSELYQRRITSLKTKTTFAQQQSIQITSFLNTTIGRMKISAESIIASIAQRASIFKQLLTSQAQFNKPDIGLVIFGNEIMDKNLSFASSQQSLRPQLYLITNDTNFHF